MKKLLGCCVIAWCVIAFSAGTVLAQKKTPEQRKEDTLIANINAMRNQEVKLGDLQQLLVEAEAKLIQMQTVFCDRYKLDLDKFRVGQYLYDEKTRRFIEKEVGEE